jgi:hypothetical protein
MLGFTLKKLFGLNRSLTCSTGILDIDENVSGVRDKLVSELTPASLRGEEYELCRR